MSRWWVAVVDDHTAVRTSLTRALNAYGIAAEGFGSAEEYLRQGHPRSPSCLVLDVQLPGMSGPELQALLAAGVTSPPFTILISANGDLLRNSMPTSTAYAYLQKPFPVDALIELVKVHAPLAR